MSCMVLLHAYNEQYKKTMSVCCGVGSNRFSGIKKNVRGAHVLFTGKCVYGESMDTYTNAGGVWMEEIDDK